MLGLLFLLMIAMPISGWRILSADGDPIPYFGLRLPAFVAPDVALAEQIEELCETGGTIGCWLIGMHVVAALLHNYLRGDNTSRRMLGQSRARRA